MFDGGDELVVKPSEHLVNRGRAFASLGVLVVVAVAAGLAIYRERHSFVASLERVGPWPMLASFVLAMVGTGATSNIWRSILDGLGVKLSWRVVTRVFFVSQLGKYLPGSVWPALMQMEAGRARGASRRTMLAANLVTLVLSCAVGLVLACLLLPLSQVHALAHYWWVLLALPPLLALLHPRAFPLLLDRAFMVMRRTPLGERLSGRAEAQAAAWSVVSWIGLGAHLAVLCMALGQSTFSTFILCVGGMGLAVPAGVLFIPAPAGAGIRDVVLKLVLGVTLGAGPALAVVVASRVILIACDVVLAGLASLLPETSRPKS